MLPDKSNLHTALRGNVKRWIRRRLKSVCRWTSSSNEAFVILINVVHKKLPWIQFALIEVQTALQFALNKSETNWMSYTQPTQAMYASFGLYANHIISHFYLASCQSAPPALWTCQTPVFSDWACLISFVLHNYEMFPKTWVHAALAGSSSCWWAASQ